ncbi:MAG: hypothetical protein AABW58_01080 [Nanoarchaeota archaeon]
MVETKGTAYGFFYCEASKDTIEREIPSLKVAGRVPNLEVLLYDLGDLSKIDRQLQDFFNQQTGAGDLNYVLKGILTGRTNFETARQVSHLLMQMDQSYLNRLGEVWGNVVYQDDSGRFVFLA